MVKREDVIKKLDELMNEQAKVPTMHQVIEFWISTGLDDCAEYNVSYFSTYCDAETFIKNIIIPRRSQLEYRKNGEKGMPWAIYFNGSLYANSKIDFVWED